MGLGRFLVHRVSVVRRGTTLDDADDPVLDEYGQPVTTERTIASGVPVSIQPKSARELADFTQAGAGVSTHTIYLYPRDLTTADVLVHDPDTCPARTDLSDGRYEITSVPDAAGAGRHLEVDARLVGSPQQAYAVPAGVGS